MRGSRKFWSGMIAGGIVGAVIGVAAMPRMRKSWSMLDLWRPEVAEAMGKQIRRAGKIARAWGD